MPITKGYKALLAEANAQITTYTVAQAQAKVASGGGQIVDIRDPRELIKGTVPGSVHAPRGMLEFWVDPESPYFKPMWADDSQTFILICGGGWRSALAAKALQDMGMQNVAHIEGGWEAWVREGGAVQMPARDPTTKP
jgi:rhodanese-related sulfurtransferase